MAGKTVCIMQPTYLPWLGYMDMIDQTDLMVLLDTVQFQPKSWQCRNRVVDTNGNMVWLTVPTSSSRGELLQHVKIAEDKRWRRKHWGTIKGLGNNAYYLWDRYDYEWAYLTGFTTTVLIDLCIELGIETPMVLASELDLPWSLYEDPLERIADICRITQADELLDTAGARDVLGAEEVCYPDGRSVPIRYHEYEPQPYDQGTETFTPYMSAVDCLARHGAETTMATIRAGRIDSRVTT